MQKISLNGHGRKKARVWNMAQFQTRRWKQAEEAKQPTDGNTVHPTTPKPESLENLHDSQTTIDSGNRQSEIVTPPRQTAPTNDPAKPVNATQPTISEPQPLKILGDSETKADPVNHQSQIVNPLARTGKVARLPENIRFEVNRLLRHNLKYSDICQKLAELGHPEITPQNISNWKNGGFIDWYREQQEREARLAPLKALERCTRAVDIDLWQQNAVALAAEKFTAIMGQFSHSRALEALYEKPELLPKYIAAMTALSRCTTELAKGFAISQDREAILRQQLNLSSAGPDPIEEDDDQPSAQVETPQAEAPSPKAENPVTETSASPVLSPQSTFTPQPALEQSRPEKPNLGSISLTPGFSPVGRRAPAPITPKAFGVSRKPTQPANDLYAIKPYQGP